MAYVCHHPRLTPAANCRFCLVEIEGDNRLRPACKTPIQDGMSVLTGSPKVATAQKQILRYVVVNHPGIACTKCSEDVECGLKTECTAMSKQKYNFGGERKSTYEADLGPLMTLLMSRCVHCTRCIRFNNEVAGGFNIGTTGRGRGTEISTYVSQQITSELSGCIVDVCPVAALTHTPISSLDTLALKNIDSHDVSDSVGTRITMGILGDVLSRYFPAVHDGINEEWMSDRTRWSWDGLKRQRLSEFMFRNEKGSLVEGTKDEALQALATKLKTVNKDKVYGLIGQHADLETIVSFRDFMHKLGVENLEAKGEGFAVNPDFRGNYLMNSRITGIEEADVCLLIGTNPKLEAPVLNSRIKKGVFQNDLKVAMIGTSDDMTYEFEHLGNSKATLNALADGTHPYLETLKNAEKPMIILGAH